MPARKRASAQRASASASGDSLEPGLVGVGPHARKRSAPRESKKCRDTGTFLCGSIRTAHRYVAAARRPLHGRTARSQSSAVRGRRRDLPDGMGVESNCEVTLSLTAPLSTVTVFSARPTTSQRSKRKGYPFPVPRLSRDPDRERKAVRPPARESPRASGSRFSCRTWGTECLLAGLS